MNFYMDISTTIATLHMKISYGFEISIAYMIFLLRRNYFLFKQLQSFSFFYRLFELIFTLLLIIHFQKCMILFIVCSWNLFLIFILLL